jgi:hypothetical protein
VLARRLSLRARVTLVTAGAAAIVLTLGALLLYAGLSTSLNAAVTEELRIRAGDVAAELAAGAAAVPGEGFPTQVMTQDGTVLEPAGDEPLLEQSELEQARRGGARPSSIVGSTRSEGTRGCSPCRSRAPTGR